MKAYVTGRFHDKENIRAIYKMLLAHGHTITLDWTTYPHLKPYFNNPDDSEKAALMCISAIAESDIFIFLTHPEVAGGSSVELGAAILSYEVRGKPIIYMVGQYNTQVLFYYHPAVNRRETIASVIEELLLQE